MEVNFLDIQEIIERFSLISNISLKESVKWEPILCDVIAEIKSRLRENIDVEMHGRRLNTAAAALSFYKFSLYRASQDSTTSFSAGGIRIHEDSRRNIQSAYSIWNEAKALISDLIRDDDFCFGQVISHAR